MILLGHVHFYRFFAVWVAKIGKTLKQWKTKHWFNPVRRFLEVLRDESTSQGNLPPMTMNNMKRHERTWQNLLPGLTRWVSFRSSCTEDATAARRDGVSAPEQPGSWGTLVTGPLKRARTANDDSQRHPNTPAEPTERLRRPTETNWNPLECCAKWMHNFWKAC